MKELSMLVDIPSGINRHLERFMDFARLKNIDRKYWIFAGGLLLAVLVFFAFIARSRAEDANTYQTTPAQRGTLTASVGATGIVRARQSAPLTWQTSGRLKTINVTVGDSVKTDDVLASLAQSSVPQNVVLAEADLVMAQENLNTLQQSGLSLAQAQQNLADAKQALKDAQDKYDSLLRKRVSDELVQDLLDQIEAAQNRLKFFEKIFRMFFEHLYDGSPRKAEQIINLSNARQNEADLIARYNWFTGSPDPTKVAQAKSALDLAKARVEDAQRELDRFENGSNAGELATAQAKVAAAQSTLNQSKIIAPFNGTVTKAQAQVGDIVLPGTSAFVVEDLSQLYVDLQVSEVDINSVAVDQPVTLTFDAVQDKVYNGKVVKVNLSGDVTSGTVSFTIKVEITDSDEQVKPGMTAAVTITVKEIQNALLVPNRAVRVVGGQRVVYVLKNGQPVAVTIRLGAISDPGSEVVGGNLKEGDQIIMNPPSDTDPNSGS
jgi:HlyD family secretion protein